MSPKHASAVATDATSPIPSRSDAQAAGTQTLPSRRALRGQSSPQAQEIIARHALRATADVPRSSAVPVTAVSDAAIQPYFSVRHFELGSPQALPAAHVVRDRSGGTYRTRLHTDVPQPGASQANPPAPEAGQATNDIAQTQRIAEVAGSPYPLANSSSLEATPEDGDDDAPIAFSPIPGAPAPPMSRKQLRVEHVSPSRSRRPAAPSVTTRRPRLVISSPATRPAQHSTPKVRPAYTRTVQVTSLAAGLAIVAGSGYAVKATADQRTEQAAQGQHVALQALDVALNTVATSDQVVQAETERELERSNDVSRQLQETAIRQSQAIQVASQALTNGQQALARSKDVLNSSQLQALSSQVDQLKTSIDSGDISGMVDLAQQVSTGAGDVTEAMKHLDPSMNGRLPDSYLCDISFAPGYRLRCDAAEALEQLNAAYKADFGKDMELNSAYRSYGEQISVRSSRGYWAASPGTSQHGWGVAVDFSSATISGYKTTADAWLLAHAPTYGFYRPAAMVPGSKISWAIPEYWHWEFGGDLGRAPSDPTDS